MMALNQLCYLLVAWKNNNMYIALHYHKITAGMLPGSNEKNQRDCGRRETNSKGGSGVVVSGSQTRAKRSAVCGWFRTRISVKEEINTIKSFVAVHPKWPLLEMIDIPCHSRTILIVSSAEYLNIGSKRRQRPQNIYFTD